jgi:hypothetical protein
VFHIHDAKKALKAACERLGYANFSHRNIRQCLILRLWKAGVDKADREMARPAGRRATRHGHIYGSVRRDDVNTATTARKVGGHQSRATDAKPGQLADEQPPLWCRGSGVIGGDNRSGDRLEWMPHDYNNGQRKSAYAPADSCRVYEL